MNPSGMRGLVEEKPLLTEFSKLLHVARANARESRNRTRHAPKSSQTKPHAPPPRSARRSKRGGTVWMLLKGGFSNIPLSDDTERMTRCATFRGNLSERRRLRALEAAEAYVRTAWQQAERAGLCQTDAKTPSEEGVQYLREQYAVAAAMLRVEPVGAHMRRLLAPSETNPKLSDQTDVFDRDAWGAILARENVIRYRFATGGAPPGMEETSNAEVSVLGERYYFPLSEAVAQREGGEERDVKPTKCIVRLRGSGKRRHTCLLATSKAVNYFKSNFMQILRKELSGSKLPRGEEAVEGHKPQPTHTTETTSGGNKSSKKRH